MQQHGFLQSCLWLVDINTVAGSTILPFDGQVSSPIQSFFLRMADR